MSKHWKRKINKLKNKKMEEYREDITPEKIVSEVKQAEPEIEPSVIQLRQYQNKFLSVQAYRLPESSTVHCADGKKLLGNAGDFYIQLDRVQEFILPEDVFRKMFILKTEK